MNGSAEKVELCEQEVAVFSIVLFKIEHLQIAVVARYIGSFYLDRDHHSKAVTQKERFVLLSRLYCFARLLQQKLNQSLSIHIFRYAHLLRRIRKSLVESGAASKYLLYAIGEIGCVVIGILLALQVHNWNEVVYD